MNKKVYVIHENDDWTRHLTARLDEVGVPYESWHLDQGHFDLAATPPEGVYYNRMSASSHTRGHRYAPELTGAVLDWLELNNRRVLNGSKALSFELSKVKQYTALECAGIKTPKTVFAVGKSQIIEAARELGVVPFITKHNRAGKGLGVHLFDSIEALAEYVNGPSFDESVDGITLVQQYIKSPGGFITRAEFVGGKYLYSVRVLTEDGFQLCPVDNCQIEFASCPAGYEEEAKAISIPTYTGLTNLINQELTASFCASEAQSLTAIEPSAQKASFDAEASEAVIAVGENLEDVVVTEPMKFEIIADAETVTGKYRELVTKIEAFLKANQIDVAGVEFIEDEAGNLYVYDVNTNTNYNKEAEAKANKFGMLELAKLLKATTASTVTQ